jgi:hypothetical protein
MLSSLCLGYRLTNVWASVFLISTLPHYPEIGHNATPLLQTNTLHSENDQYLNLTPNEKIHPVKIGHRSITTCHTITLHSENDYNYASIVPQTKHNININQFYPLGIIHVHNAIQ